MRDHLATVIDDLRSMEADVAVVRYQGNRRRVTTYGELARLAGRFAALLAKRKIGQGDRVLIWGENSAEWIAAFYGCMVRGVLAVPLDANGTAEFARRVVADVRPKLAVGDERLLTGLGSAADAAKVPMLEFEHWLGELPTAEMGAVSTLSRKTPLQILFTSGTTGEPKGVVLTHGNVLASVGPIEDGARPYMRYERYVHPLRILHTLPLSHVFGQTMGLWIPPILKAELHFESRLAAPRLIDLIRSERISVLAAVPRVLALLKTHLEMDDPGLAQRALKSQKRRLGGALRWLLFRKVHREFGLKFWAFVSGGGALPAQVEQFWNALGFVLVQGYGMTETTALITLNHPFHVARGTIGKPLAGREVKLGPDGEVLVRGPMISSATWQDGALQPRTEQWLATGDLAEKQKSGELRFLGRKSEVIVTASGVNLHPEDIEAAVEEQPEVAACAVVPMQTGEGPEPCAVLAVRGSGDQAARAVERANANLAEFQRVRRWVLWPEPDLPRTSTGKVKRKPVEAWLARIQAAGSATSNGAHRANGAFGLSSDWLLALIAQVSGEAPRRIGDELRLTEDFHLDSLGRVQLAAAIEERLGIVQSNGLLEEVQTLGDLRRLVAGGDLGVADEEPTENRDQGTGVTDRAYEAAQTSAVGTDQVVARAAKARRRYVYPTWPWWKPVQWIRSGFVEGIMRPLVWLLAPPRVVRSGKPMPAEPMLIIANHVTSYDGPFVQYALPGPVRRRLAVAMSGDMLEDFRNWRNARRMPADDRFYFWGKPAYWLVTALFNVFPLPKHRDFQASFAHAGRALDKGYNVLVFPEGALAGAGKMARFRLGIGLLAKQSEAPVLPVAIRGLGELTTGEKKWFRSGTIEVVVGEPIRFGPDDSEAAITARLQEEVERLLGDGAARGQVVGKSASQRVSARGSLP